MVAPRLLLDTHIIIRWLVEPRRLSKQQSRILDLAVDLMNPLAISAITLLEIAILVSERKLQVKADASELLSSVGENPIFRVLPLNFEVAAEVLALGPALRDPADRTIVATARVHRCRLVTSDQRILESRLVPTID